MAITEAGLHSGLGGEFIETDGFQTLASRTLLGLYERVADSDEGEDAKQLNMAIDAIDTIRSQHGPVDEQNIWLAEQLEEAGTVDNVLLDFLENIPGSRLVFNQEKDSGEFSLRVFSFPQGRMDNRTVWARIYRSHGIGIDGARRVTYGLSRGYQRRLQAPVSFVL